MTRPRFTWLAFALCLALVSAAMGWMSRRVLELERAEAVAARQYENERLALWRIESALVPLISTESGRPPSAYQAFYKAEHAYSNGTPVAKGAVQVPSSLLSLDSPHIKLHFQCAPSGELSSPQVPPSEVKTLAEDNYTTRDRIEKAAAFLAECKSDVSWGRLLAALEHEPSPAAAQLPTEVPSEPAAIAVQEAEYPFQQQLGKGADSRQTLRSYAEYQSRNRAAAQNTMLPNNAYFVADSERNAATGEPPDEHLPPMKGLWLDDSLVLARVVNVAGSEFVQGCLLDWPEIRRWLVGEVADLLPDASLVPAEAAAPEDQPLMLASLPVRLVPGRVPSEPLPMLTPIRFSLAIAWICLALAAAAVAALLLAAVRLSERRGAFVSAVTHELRTPLTTFRLYTEMLAEGIVPTEEKRRAYLQTLRAEAERLGHLVENVLSYARLERTSAGAVREPIVLDELLARIGDSLRERASRAEMTLRISMDGEPALVGFGDGGAVERILFNLVDNASKYAAQAEPRWIDLSAHREGNFVAIRVRDYGAGISPQQARRLFRPFSKSAHEAAHSAPGVGLGLALSRRLARSMGGDLRVELGEARGACFVLTLPAAA